MFVKHRRHFIIVDDISRFGETAERNSLQETYSGEKTHFFYFLALDAHKLSKDVLLESQCCTVIH